jgi:hypothetical protein
MDNAMSPSIITDPQITKLGGNMRAMLEKYRKEFPSEPSQRALENPACMKEMFAVFRKYVEAESKIIIRTAKPNRLQTFAQAIVATGCTPYLNDDVVANAPKADGDFEGIFVNIGRNVDCGKLDFTLAGLGFELIVDPQGLAQVNADDPTFADKYPNGTQWKDVEGKYCCAVFDCWYVRRRVNVIRDGHCWHGDYWFPCRRISTESLTTVS